MATNKKFVRSRSNRIIAGVCGGIADYFNIDVNLVRIGAIIIGLLTSGTATLIYLLAWAFVPEADTGITGADTLVDKYAEYRRHQNTTPPSQTGPDAQPGSFDPFREDGQH